MYVLSSNPRTMAHPLHGFLTGHPVVPSPTSCYRKFGTYTCPSNKQKNLNLILVYGVAESNPRICLLRTLDLFARQRYWNFIWTGRNNRFILG